MIITGLDFETTGLDNPRIIAVGITMYDVTVTDGKNEPFPIRAMSHLIDPGDAIFEPGAIEAHGITPEFAKKWGCPESEAINDVASWIAQSDYVAAYNGNAYDKGILLDTAKRLGIAIPSKTWIDAYTDLEHEKTDDLIGQCAKHGFLLDDQHSALADVQAMMRLLFKHDLARVIEIASSPMIYLRADVTYDEKDLAKVRGYKWNEKNRPDSWTLATREMFMQKEIDEAPFGLDIAKNGKWELLRPKKSAHPGVVEI